MATAAAVDAFLSTPRVAFVGLSSDEADFSHAVYRAWAATGVELVPVHPTAEVLEGHPVARTVGEIEPPVEAVYVMVNASRSADVVRDAISAGARRVWLHSAGVQGAVSDEAVALCREAGIDVVDGQCPMMFLKGAGFGHRLHRLFKQITGTLPA